jgi:hypothetical protein
MIPEATQFKEFYSDLHQLQALDTPGYQSAKLQGSRVFVVEHRREGFHRGTSEFSAPRKVASYYKERALETTPKSNRSGVMKLRPSYCIYSPEYLEEGEFSEVRIQQYGYSRCSTSLNGTFDST